VVTRLHLQARESREDEVKMPMAMLEEGEQMRPAAYVPLVQVVEDVLRSLDQRHRLVTLVATMAEEIERLTEDNAQLRAAVTMYREVARRGSGRAASQ
jgi:hypothetical protein